MYPEKQEVSINSLIKYFVLNNHENIVIEENCEELIIKNDNVRNVVKVEGVVFK